MKKYERKLIKLTSFLLSAILCFSIFLLDFTKVVAAEATKTQAEAITWVKSKVGGSALDYDGYYGAQCVDFIAYYLNFLGASSLIGGNASAYANKTMPSGWQKIAYYNGFTAKAGDIAIWTYTTSSAGHVAIVTSANTTSMTVVDQNGWNGAHHTNPEYSTYKYTQWTFYGVIRPKFKSTYNIAYNANGGTGTMASRTITEGTTFTPSKCTFTKSGYYFAGYNVCRKSDSKWYVKGTGWFTNSEITNSGYKKSVYNNGTNYVFNGSWTNGVNPGETYTFYPIWKPNSTKLWFYPNYSGCNYVMGGGLDSRMSSYINSRDTSIYTLSVDSSQRLNNQNSIKIVATSAGSSGHDMKIATSTNWGLTSGVTGDNRKMTLTFWAKSSVSGAKMYFCWANNSTYKNVTLTNEWKKYSIDMTKNIYSGGSIHPYMDKAGTFWINSLTLCDGSNGTNNYTRYEDGYTIPNQVYNYGDTYNSLPTPVRDGYKFVGWYTQNEGGTQITTSTKVFDYDTNVYAHWEKEISNVPIEDIILPNGREYALYDNAVSWEKAKELCENAGGHLVTISSQEENDLIYEIVKDKNNFLWLGAKLNENTQQWEWITGEEFGYTNWDTGEPNSLNAEFYAQMYPTKLGFGNNAGCWNDSFGELSAWHSYFGFQNSMYICEFEPLYGDTDGDREITITDATNIQKSIVSLMDFSDEQTKYFDINNDGKKDIKDVSLIQKIVAGIITAWRVSEY